MSLGISISGDMAPPAWASTGWPVAVHSSASAAARWSSQTMVSQRSSPVVETVTGRAGGVAEDERAGGVEGEAGDGLRPGGGLGAGGAQRGAGGLPDWRGVLLGLPGVGRVGVDRMLGAAEQAAGGVEEPARALPVPTSTAATSGISGGGAAELPAPQRRSAAAADGRPDEGGELAHVGDDRVRAERGHAGAVLVARGMASSGEGHHPHAGGLRRHDPRRAVLDHQAGGGSVAEGRGRVQEEVGGGLAAR